MRHSRVFLVVLYICLLSACSNDDTDRDRIRIKGKYTHALEDCETLEGPEENCTEFADFLNDTEVGLLLGGGDVVFTTTYNIDGNIIQIEQTTELPEEITFEIESSTTLRGLQDNSLWIKEE